MDPRADDYYVKQLKENKDLQKILPIWVQVLPAGTKDKPLLASQLARVMTGPKAREALFTQDAKQHFGKDHDQCEAMSQVLSNLLFPILCQCADNADETQARRQLLSILNYLDDTIKTVMAEQKKVIYATNVGREDVAVKPIEEEDRIRASIVAGILAGAANVFLDYGDKEKAFARTTVMSKLAKEYPSIKVPSTTAQLSKAGVGGVASGSLTAAPSSSQSQQPPAVPPPVQSSPAAAPPLPSHPPRNVSKRK